MITNRYKLQKQSAFSIVELLVVIVVIGILAAITVVAYTGVSQKAVVSTLQSDLTSAANKLKLYLVDNSTYPTTLSDSGGGVFCPTPADARYCIKLSPNESLEVYYGTANTFKLVIKYNTTKYQITENTSPTIAGDTTFIKSYSNGGSLSVNDAQQTNDGGYVLVGGYGDNGFMLSKYTSDLTLSWMKTWDGTGYGSATSVIQTSDGGFVVAGDADYYRIILSKYSSDGNLLWTKTFSGPSLADYGPTLIQTSDGGFAAVAVSEDFGAGAHEGLLIRYASDGTFMWSKTFGGTNWDNFNDIIQTSDNGFLIVGDTLSYSASGGANWDWDSWLIKTASDGTLSWSKTWGGASADWISRIIKTSDGGFMVLGNTYSFGNTKSVIYLAKYTSDGTVSWSKSYGGTGGDLASVIVATNDGAYLVTGLTQSFGVVGYDSFLAKIASDGTLIWYKTWGGSGNEGAGNVIQTSDGGLVIIGSNSSADWLTTDLYLAKFDSNGNMSNCLPSMCKTQSPSVSTITTAMVTSPSPTVTTPSPTLSTRSPIIVNRTPTTTYVVYP